ncbi:ISL3 family transposase, partial [Kitasatospora sp. NPDC048298]|uniref:ISL3 family transposase n=1 Tax=Kitasatospora sp. NPDC048298 TaxID=3364049 RepID=UPI003723DCA1
MKLLLPHLSGLVVEEVRDTETGLRITARSASEQACCPGCGAGSARVHDRYRRRIADLAVGGRAATIALSVRRFRCQTSGCPRRTFAEQVEGLTFRYGRRSLLQRGLLEAVALALAGRAGSRLAEHLHCRAGANTLLNLIRTLPDPPLQRAPRVLGVDDFALKRGHVYATVLIDIEARRPIDVLPDRTAETLADWLRKHPGAEIVCRDRASAYAEAVRTAAPDAVQVADRFHLWKNLAETVEKCVIAHRACLKNPDDQAQIPAPAPEPQVQLPDGRRASTTRERFATVKELYGKGVGIGRIAELLGLDRKTVRKYAHAPAVEELLVPSRQGGRALTPWVGYLNQRWNDGCTDSGLLFREIQTLGYRGSNRSVRRWLEPLRSSPAPAPRLPTTLTVRQATGWLTRHPDALTSDEALQLKHLLARCPELATAAERVRDFALMMKNLDGEHLPEWIEQTEATNLPPLRNFARHLRQDLDAVTAGLTLRWNSGPVEGHVNLEVTWNLSGVIMSPRCNHGLGRRLERREVADG